jgi:hypothetical protein
MKNQNFMLKRFFLLAAAVVVVVAVVLFSGFASQAWAATYTVDTTSDNAYLNACTSAPADCSLYGAVNKANNNYDRSNTIVFAIPLTSSGCVGGVCTIIVRKALKIAPILSAKSLYISNSSGPTRLIFSGNYQTLVILNEGILTLEGVTIKNGSSYAYAGGITNTVNGRLTLKNSIVTNNSSTGTSVGNAGGIFSAGSLTVSYSTISNNSTQYYGGGIASHGSLTINNSTISGNTAHTGGGIYTDSRETLQHISNSTISGNTALQGGGIYNRTTSSSSNNLVTLVLQSVTVTNNAATASGGLGINSGGVACLLWYSSMTSTSFGKGYLSVFNSIVAGNHFDEAPDIAGYIGGYARNPADDSLFQTTSGSSLIGDGAGVTIYSGATYLIGTAANPIDPLLGPLANNAGPTKTHALLPGSPAIDTGSSVFQNIDQRGAPRVYAADMGAYELQ